MFEIEEGIPVPEKGVFGASKYPWAAMKVGDSFFVPGSTKKNFQGTVYQVAKKTGATYRVENAEKVTDGETVAGVRCWRVA